MSFQLQSFVYQSFATVLEFHFFVYYRYEVIYCMFLSYFYNLFFFLTYYCYIHFLPHYFILYIFRLISFIRLTLIGLFLLLMLVSKIIINYLLVEFFFQFFDITGHLFVLFFQVFLCNSFDNLDYYLFSLIWPSLSSFLGSFQNYLLHWFSFVFHVSFHIDLISILFQVVILQHHCESVSFCHGQLVSHHPFDTF